MMSNDSRRHQMTAESAASEPDRPPLRTLADKVNWLIGTAHPAGRGPYSNSEVTDLIRQVTGEQFSHTTIWKLRNGQATNPQMRLIEALAQTFGVPPAFFFGDYDEQQAGLLRDQVELLAVIRDSKVTAAQMRSLLELSTEAIQAIADLIRHTGREKPPGLE
jgi:transcriptional regulator with XRE-family HTH domain